MRVLRANEFGSLQTTRLAAFETHVGCLLPEDYRAWLLAHNGGELEPADFWISPAEGDSTVHHILGLHDGPVYARLDWVRAAYHGRMPVALLTVADDVCGNAICLGLVGATRGRVYFWDHEREAPTHGERHWDNVTELAPSWPAFLAALRDASAEDPEAAG